jgi:tetratricopeptide (TPR) repeat protein/tRNA A-37 threonylcarbamoyl transferase component Bud32
VRVSLEPFPEEPPLSSQPAPPEAGEPASVDSAIRNPQSAFTRFGDYELLEEIARGGMGVVYKARQVSLNRTVAVKMILTGQLASAADVQRFRAEAESAARLQHPNIVAIHEIGQHEGQHYFSMDYVDGQNLAQLVGQKPMSPKQAAKYLETIAEAIHHAHQQGILHRDLKPSNILIDNLGQPRVTDFGLAKQIKGASDLTVSGQVLGSPNFMPPEQAAGKRGHVGPWSDVYALGAILFYMLTGRPPFAAETMAETLQLVANTEPLSPRLLSPGVPRDLETICLKCLEKESRLRYGTVRELADELGRFLRDEPILARPINRIEKTWRWCLRKPAVATAIGLVVALVLVIGVGSPIAVFRINQERLRAQADRKKAENEAFKSKQVARFLQDMLEGVGPSKALGRDTTMLKEILDKTAARLSQELASQPEAQIELLDVLARTYGDLGLYQQAAEMARESLRLARAHFGEEDLSVAQALLRLGEAQLHLGNFKEAEESIRAAQAMYRKLLGKEHAEVATSLDNLGIALCNEGKFPEAATLAREALEMRRKLLGNTNHEVVLSLNNLAFALQREGKLAEAESLSREAIATLKKLVGDEHPEVATFLDNLGLILCDEGKWAEAENAHREALAMRRKVLSDDHPDVAVSLHNLAVPLQRQGKLAEAETAVREALAIERKRLGEHPDVAFCLNTLALILKLEGKLAEAEETHREALAMRRKLLSDEHPDVAASLNGLAQVLDAQGKLVEGEELHREALAIVRKALGTNNTDFAFTLNKLSLNLQQQGKFEAAEAACREALAITRKLLGNVHPYTISVVDTLAFILEKEGKLTDAESLIRTQLTELRARPTADGPELAIVLARLASTLIAEKKFADAEEPARECLAIREKKLPDDWVTFDTRSVLGGTLLGQQKYAEAEPELLSGYEGMKQREAKVRGGNGEPRLREALQRLVQLYEATNRPEQAADWKNKLEEFDKSRK